MTIEERSVAKDKLLEQLWNRLCEIYQAFGLSCDALPPFPTGPTIPDDYAQTINAITALQPTAGQLADPIFRATMLALLDLVDSYLSNSEVAMALGQYGVNLATWSAQMRLDILNAS